MEEQIDLFLEINDTIFVYSETRSTFGYKPVVYTFPPSGKRTGLLMSSTVKTVGPVKDVFLVTVRIISCPFSHMSPAVFPSMKHGL